MYMDMRVSLDKFVVARAAQLSFSFAHVPNITYVFVRSLYTRTYVRARVLQLQCYMYPRVHIRVYIREDAQLAL